MRRMGMKNLKILQENVKSAQNQLYRAMKDMWSTGSECRFLLNSKQKTPTEGIVLGHNFDGYINVFISKSHDNSRRPTRNIYFENMIFEENKEQEKGQ
jgi:hypothetical protein